MADPGSSFGEGKRLVGIGVTAVQPLLPLFANTSVYGIKTGIEGFTANANTRTESWQAASWYWA